MKALSIKPILMMAALPVLAIVKACGLDGSSDHYLAYKTRAELEDMSPEIATVLGILTETVPIASKGPLTSGFSPLGFKKEEMEYYLSQRKYAEVCAAIGGKPYSMTGSVRVEKSIAFVKHSTTVPVL
ncbi:MAG: hypothetical protein GDA36_11365 [Rhodobacteraceae bacterium]|nr:hypothetical protein [Paracoccaceae bacterium]